MKFGLNMGLFGSATGGGPPIETGDFIWYTYDPVDGYQVDVDSNNLVVDHGINLLTPRITGQYHGDVFASNAVYLDGADDTNFVDLDTHIGGELTFTDPETQNIITVDTPLDTYRQQVSFSNAVSHDISFSQADLDLMASDPLTLMRVWKSGLVLPSGFAKVNMKHYYPANEGVVGGAIVQDLTADLGANQSVNGTFDTDMTGWSGTAIWDNGRAKILADTNELRQATVPDLVIGKSYRVTFDIENETSADIRLMCGGVVIVQKTLANGTYSYVFTSTIDSGGYQIYFRSYGFTGWIDNVILEEVTASEIQGYIEANRAVFRNGRKGMNDLRLVKDTSGRVESIIDSRLARFDGTGQVIDTGIAIDGSVTNFSMFMAFTLPETSKAQFIAYTSVGDNRLFIWRDSTFPANQVQVGVGNFAQNVTLDEANPIHALGVVFNHVTSEIGVAVDGNVLPTTVPITFDGSTGVVMFGGSSVNIEADSFTGYVGEGILTADLLDEAQWQEFWLRVKDTVI